MPARWRAGPKYLWKHRTLACRLAPGLPVRFRGLPRCHTIVRDLDCRTDRVRRRAVCIESLVTVLREDPAEHAEAETRHWPRSTIRNCSVVSFVGRIADRATPGPAYNATERAGEPDRSRRRSGNLPADGLSGCQAIHPHDVRDALFNEQVWDELKRWMAGFEASMVPSVGIETDGESCESEFEEPYRQSGPKTGTERSVLLRQPHTSSRRAARVAPGVTPRRHPLQEHERRAVGSGSSLRCK